MKKHRAQRPPQGKLCDNVSEGQLQIVLLPLPKEEHRFCGALLLVRAENDLNPRHEACRGEEPTRCRWRK